jgi:hypothetical protein
MISPIFYVEALETLDILPKITQWSLDLNPERVLLTNKLQDLVAG